MLLDFAGSVRMIALPGTEDEKRLPIGGIVAPVVVVLACTTRLRDGLQYPPNDNARDYNR
jgi:hypothetical protein